MANGAKVSHCCRGHELATSHPRMWTRGCHLMQMPPRLDPTSRGCLPHTDVYAQSLAVLTVLASRPLALDQHDHICFHLQAEHLAPRAAWGEAQQTAQATCWASAFPRDGDPPAPRGAPTDVSYLVLSTSSWVFKPTSCPKPGRERRRILGTVLFTIFSLDGRNKGKAVSSTLLQQMPSPLGPQRCPPHPGSAGSPASQGQLAAQTRPLARQAHTETPRAEPSFMNLPQEGNEGPRMLRQQAPDQSFLSPA